MRLIFVLSTVIHVLHAFPTEHDLVEKWEDFKITYDKKYTSLEEEIFRKDLFLKMLKHVEEHNEKYKQGLVSFQIGINKFSDYTDEERHNMHSQKMFLHKISKSHNLTFVPRKKFDLPDSKDWRDEGMVTPVKDQKAQCESSWAFSVVDALESQYRILKNQEVFLSLQQVVDCTYDKVGCWGGWMDDAYQYIIKNDGLNTNEDYPYEATASEGCRYDAEKAHYSLTSFVNIERGSEPDLQTAVAQIGPVAVALDTSGDFDNYKSGIYYNPNCDPTVLTHALLVVGYGTENDQDYWLVKNSYSDQWGDQGYIKIARYQNNHCGIATAASYPVL